MDGDEAGQGCTLNNGCKFHFLSYRAAPTPHFILQDYYSWWQHHNNDDEIQTNGQPTVTSHSVPSSGAFMVTVTMVLDPLKLTLKEPSPETSPVS